MQDVELTAEEKAAEELFPTQGTCSNRCAARRSHPIPTTCRRRHASTDDQEDRQEQPESGRPCDWLTAYISYEGHYFIELAYVHLPQPSLRR